VFPEGIKGIGKLYRERYRLQRFGRGGFVKLALRTHTPVLPVAIVGSEETNPLLFRVNAFARRFGVPFIPVTPTFPLLGPLGLLPAPTKWRIVVGPPIDFGDSDEAPESVQSARISNKEIDEVRVAELTERTRSTIQGMLSDLLQDRQSVFRG
jgi:1-acyl-sn-glycerol-3-phosphate acyltransferase